MIQYLRELPAVIKMGASFVGGLATAGGLLYGAWMDHEKRITELESGNRITVCWVRAQIEHTDAQRCLFPNPPNGGDQ